MGIVLEKLQIVGIVLVNIFLIMIAFCGNEYLGKSLSKLRICSDHFKEMPLVKTSELYLQCIELCNDRYICDLFSCINKRKNICDLYSCSNNDGLNKGCVFDSDMEKILEANPKILLIIICIIFMIGLSILAYYNTKVVVNYRRALELYQVCLSEFKETPRTKVAKKYLKDDPIMEDEDEYMSRNTVAHRNKKFDMASSPGFQRNISIKVKDNNIHRKTDQSNRSGRKTSEVYNRST